MMLAQCPRFQPVIAIALRHLVGPAIADRTALWPCVLTIPAILLTAVAPATAQRAPANPPAIAAPAPAAAPSTPPAGPVGVWLDDTGRGAVEIKPCGTNLCGSIYWLQQPTAATTGRPVTDVYNPDSAKRTRAVCGLQVIGGVKPQGDGNWDEGWIYDPKVGNSYDVAIALEKKDRLSVTGYKGVKFLSKTFIWTRAPASLQRCDVSVTEKNAAPALPATGAAQRALPPPARASTTPPPSPTQR